MWFREAEGNELFVLTSRPEDLVPFSGQCKSHCVIGQKICLSTSFHSYCEPQTKIKPWKIR